ncbi:MAG TPA: hypothetical protein VN803_06845 [Gemmatimonadales bacterium]|nr:hypothetical protein [Gemmatimonadales bacterium]
MAVYVFQVNGVTKDLQPGWSIQESGNGRNRMQFAVLSLDGSFRIVNDDVVTLTEDGTTIFGGLVDAPAESGFAGSSASDAIEQRLSAFDFNVYPSRITVGADTDRPSESLEARLTWIAGLLTAQGVSVSGAQVTGPTLPAASYTADQFLVDVLNDTVALASGTGATSWVWNVDYSKELSAVEAGTAAAPFNITDGDDNVIGDVTVEQPRPATFANYIILLGGQGTRDVSDTFSGDGVTTTFALTYSLAASYGYVTVNGVFETLGTGATWTYDSATNSITRASAPPAGTDNIVITYVGQFPKRVVADSGVPAANRRERVYKKTDVFDVAIMQALAESYLTRDSQEPKTVRYGAAFDKTELHPGQTQTITNTKRNLSAVTVLFTDVQIRHIAGDLVQRQVTAVTTTRLPATIREQFQQAFGGGGGAASSSGITIITGGTFLSSPASLGGSDITWRACDTATRVPNAQPYDAPATMAVTVKGLVSSRTAQNVTVILWDETDGAVEFSSVVAATSTPTAFSFTGTIASGHRYWLYVQAGTAGISATACGQVAA